MIAAASPLQLLFFRIFEQFESPVLHVFFPRENFLQQLDYCFRITENNLP